MQTGQLATAATNLNNFVFVVLSLDLGIQFVAAEVELGHRSSAHQGYGLTLTVRRRGIRYVTPTLNLNNNTFELIAKIAILDGRMEEFFGILVLWYLVNVTRV